MSERARILVADDDAFARRVMTDLLKEIGCDVVEAFDGPTALDQAAQWDPDLILADVVMPRLDGVATRVGLLFVVPLPVSPDVLKPQQ